MKVIDTRDGSTLHGHCVAVIPAGKDMPSREVLRIYGLNPGHKAWSIMTRPCGYDRLVMSLGSTVDRHYRIFQKYPHHELREDDRPHQDDIDAQLFAEVAA